MVSSAARRRAARCNNSIFRKVLSCKGAYGSDQNAGQRSRQGQGQHGQEKRSCYKIIHKYPSSKVLVKVVAQLLDVLFGQRIAVNQGGSQIFGAPFKKFFYKILGLCTDVLFACDAGCVIVDLAVVLRAFFLCERTLFTSL